MHQRHLRAEYHVAPHEVVFYLIDPNEEPDGKIPDPLVSVDADVIQVLLDDLWRAGFRPKEAEPREGEVSAKNEHIADLQRYLDRTLPAAIGQEE